MGQGAPGAISDLRLITDQPQPISPLERSTQSAGQSQDQEEAMEQEFDVPTDVEEEQGEVRE
eukprot:2478916-Heterocapsa_arctica.AAC.1